VEFGVWTWVIGRIGGGLLAEEGERVRGWRLE